MKNLFYVAVLALSATLVGCASDDASEGPNYRYVGNTGGCDKPSCQQQAEPVTPVRSPCAARVQRQAPVVQQQLPCDSGCPSKQYTVRTPVRVVYKATTYHTVYEPRTYETTAYETRPYNRAEVCESGNCGGAMQTQAPAYVPAAQPNTVSPEPVVYEK